MDRHFAEALERIRESFPDPMLTNSNYSTIMVTPFNYLSDVRRLSNLANVLLSERIITIAAPLF